MRQRLAASDQVAREYKEPALARLERQAGVIEDLVADARRPRIATADRRVPDVGRCRVNASIAIAGPAVVLGSACDLGVCCRRVSATVVSLQGVRCLFAACGCLFGLPQLA